MKNLALIATTALLAFSAEASTLKDKFSQKVSQASWPNIKYYHTFRATGATFPWDGQTIDRTKAGKFTYLADSDRDQAIIHSKISADIFGMIDVSALIDFRAGLQVVYVPFFGICQKDSFPSQGLSLRQYLDSVFRPEGGITQYLG